MKSSKQLNLLTKHASSQGLSLAELLMAAAILAFALCGLIALFVNCSGLNKANRNLSTAVSHVQYVMETIKYTPFADIQTNIDNATWNFTKTQINANGLIALRNEAIATTATGTRPIQVTVTATWQDRTGRERTFSATTLFQ